MKYAFRAGGTDYPNDYKYRRPLDRQELPAGPPVRELAGFLRAVPACCRPPQPGP